MIKNHDEQKKTEIICMCSSRDIAYFYCDIIQCNKTSLYKSTIKPNKEDTLIFDKIGQFA